MLRLVFVLVILIYFPSLHATVDLPCLSTNLPPTTTYTTPKNVESVFRSSLPLLREKLSLSLSSSLLSSLPVCVLRSHPSGGVHQAGVLFLFEKEMIFLGKNVEDDTGESSPFAFHSEGMAPR